jgi:hypothetical protein
MSTEVIKLEDQGKTIINHMPVQIRSVDRTFKDITSWWNALQQAESVYFANRSDLYDIFSTAELDGHLTGIIEKRIKNVTNKKLYYKKGGKKVDELDKLINSEAFKQLRKERFKYITHGVMGVEFIPGAEFMIKCIPLKHINTQVKRITKEQWGVEGFEYEKVWNIIVKGEDNNFGILNKCTPYAIWKKGNMGDWAQYIEVFGQPMIVFTYDAHDEKTKQELDNIMRNIGSGTKLQVPKQVELKLEDGKQNNGDGALQDLFRKACNEEMSVLVLGVTETTTSSSSSGYAQSDTHAKQQDEVTKDDMDDEQKFFNDPKILTIFKSYGFPVDIETGSDEDGFCYEEEMDLDQVKKQVDIIMTVSKRQPVDDDYVYEITGIPKPANYEALKSQMEEERKAALQSATQSPSGGGGAAGGGKPPKGGGKPQPKKLFDEEDDLTWWKRFRHSLADFFDPAPTE